MDREIQAVMTEMRNGRAHDIDELRGKMTIAACYIGAIWTRMLPNICMK